MRSKLKPNHRLILFRAVIVLFVLWGAFIAYSFFAAAPLAAPDGY